MRELSRTVARVIALVGLCALGIFTAPVFAGAPPEMAEDGSLHVSRSDIVRSTAHRDPRVSGPIRDIAIVAAASADVDDPFFTDPRDRLLASGAFSSVTVIHAGQTTPSLVELETYDAVLVWSNVSFADSETLGDNLADYVDAGHGVVVAVFANTTETIGRFLTGRWQSHGYDVVNSVGGTSTGAATLGTINDPGHPLVQSVVSFSGGLGSFRPTTTSVVSSASIVAEWSDGATLLAVREDTIGSRVDLGFYPPSDLVPGFEDFFWDDTSDGDVMLVNAMTYAADRAPLAPGDTDGDVDVDGNDALAFDGCYTGTGLGPVTAGCLTFDFDENGAVDCADWQDFLLAYTEGPNALTSEHCTIPAVSEWGMVAMALGLLAVATIVILHRQHRPLVVKR